MAYNNKQGIKKLDATGNLVYCDKIIPDLYVRNY